MTPAQLPAAPAHDVSAFTSVVLPLGLLLSAAAALLASTAAPLPLASRRRDSTAEAASSSRPGSVTPCGISGLFSHSCLDCSVCGGWWEGEDGGW